MIKKILLTILISCFVSTAHADALDKCLEKLAPSDLWQTLLFDEKEGVFKEISDSDKITVEMVQRRKSQLYTMLARGIELLCVDQIGQIVKVETSAKRRVYFTHNNEKYAFSFDVDKLFEHINDIRMGFIVINKRNLSPGDVLKLSDIQVPENKKFFSDACSDWVIWDNLDDDANVNVAGQTVFSEFGGKKNEFFLDFAEGDNRRAFPGLVLMDETGSTTEKIVTYFNPYIAVKKLADFSKLLHEGECSGGGYNLAAYLVALNVQQIEGDTDFKNISDSSNRRWAVGLSIGGDVVGGVTGMIWAPYVATGVAKVAGLLKFAAASTAVPVVGWIVGGVALAAGSAALILYPSDIEDIQQVMILDGPYMI